MEPFGFVAARSLTSEVLTKSASTLYKTQLFVAFLSSHEDLAQFLIYTY